MLEPDHRQAPQLRVLGERRQRQFYMAVHPATQKGSRGGDPGFGSMKGRGYNSVSIHGQGFPPELWKLVE